MAVWLAVGLAFARAPSARAQSDDYSFSWLDTDKKIYVLQNRKYLKGSRLLLSVMGGTGFSNPYRNSYKFDPRLAFYLNEWAGVEVFYSIIGNRKNNTYTALLASTGNVEPILREIRGMYGILLHWVPWYAKINFFNWILYFDWYLAAGGGALNTLVNDKASLDTFKALTLPAGYWATGHQYHLSRYFTVRLDFIGAIYRAYNFGRSGTNVWFSDYSVGAGIGLRI